MNGATTESYDITRLGKDIITQSGKGLGIVDLSTLQVQNR
jgi:hypothetical protein